MTGAVDDKSHASLEQLTDGWRERADRHVPRALQVAWVASLASRNDLPLLRADDLGEAIPAFAARGVLAQVSERHATFSRMNVLAEAHRLLHDARFADPAGRIETAERVSRLALGSSLPVATPEMCHAPAAYRRPDGSSRLRPESRAHHPGALRRRGPAARSGPVPGGPGGHHGHGGPFRLAFILCLVAGGPSSSASTTLTSWPACPTDRVHEIVPSSSPFPSWSAGRCVTGSSSRWASSPAR